jgi:hypothetical protein
LHSGNGWLICKVFCKSIGIRFSETNLSNSDASRVLGRIRFDAARIVFVFFTILYQLNTLMFPSRIEHKSPVNGEFRQVFP